MYSSLIIETKSQTEKELQQKELLMEVITQYQPPIFTEKVIIETGVAPHSHPVLTLNTRSGESLMLLWAFVHEQFHWFATDHPRYDECIQFLKEKYEDLGDCNVSGENPNSFWEHLIVCWNTRNFLMEALTKDYITSIYNQWQPYPLTEAFVREKFTELEKILTSLDMAYKKAS